MKALDKVGWKKRRIRGDTHGEGRLWLLRRNEIEAGENAGERTGKAVDVVDDHREAELGKSRGLAGRADEQGVALRSQDCGDAGKEGKAANRPEGFVAAHARRLAAGKQNTDRQLTILHCIAPMDDGPLSSRRARGAGALQQVPTNRRFFESVASGPRTRENAVHCRRVP